MWWEIVGWTLAGVGGGFALYVMGSLIHEERQFKVFSKKMERERREREADAANAQLFSMMRAQAQASAQTYLTYSKRTGQAVHVLSTVEEEKQLPAAPADWVGDAPKVDFL